VRRLPAEDSVALERLVAEAPGGRVRIAVPVTGRIANFDDLDPLRHEAGVSVTFVNPGEVIPADSRLVIIPGSKSTMADLAALRSEGWDVDLRAHARRGGLVLGLCGGFQMLGRHIHDPIGLEGKAGTVEGLGMLDVETRLSPDKTLTQVMGTHVPTGMAISGYEIHLGITDGPDCSRPFAMIGDRPDGARSASGQVTGTYLHGCFASDGFRAAFLQSLGAEASALRFEHRVDRTLDALASQLETHLDLDGLLALAEPV
jgi:adenosylcobyric acid synthase